MWFDRIDPRDPLQLTDGVWALLLRYFFLNNANIWLWGLYGNDDVKGWEFLPTVKDDIEFGGRIQVPVPLGELGLSYHHRRADVNRGIDQLLLTLPRHVPRTRTGKTAPPMPRPGAGPNQSRISGDSRL